jgi:hypothetical protein
VRPVGIRAPAEGERVRRARGQGKRAGIGETRQYPPAGALAGKEGFHLSNGSAAGLQEPHATVRRLRRKTLRYPPEFLPDSRPVSVGQAVR